MGLPSVPIVIDVSDPSTFVVVWVAVVQATLPQRVTTNSLSLLWRRLMIARPSVPIVIDVSDPSTFVLLDSYHVVGNSGPFDETSRRIENSVLVCKVILGHPTGDGTTPSNKDRDLVFHHSLEHFAQRRPTDWQDTADHLVSYQDNGVAHQRNLCFHASVDGRLGLQERKYRLGGILGAMSCDKSKLCHSEAPFPRGISTVLLAWRSVNRLSRPTDITPHRRRPLTDRARPQHTLTRQTGIPTVDAIEPHPIETSCAEAMQHTTTAPTPPTGGRTVGCESRDVASGCDLHQTRHLIQRSR